MPYQQVIVSSKALLPKHRQPYFAIVHFVDDRGRLILGLP